MPDRDHACQHRRDHRIRPTGQQRINVRCRIKRAIPTCCHLATSPIMDLSSLASCRSYFILPSIIAVVGFSAHFQPFIDARTKRTILSTNTGPQGFLFNQA
jgi:hypothetical protein